MTKQIASRYYMPLSADRSLYQGRFRMPAVKKEDKPFILAIPDHFQIETMPWFRGVFNGRQIQEKKTITGEEIANCLMKEWTREHPEMNPQCCPAVWIVRDVVYLVDPEGKPEMDANGRQSSRTATEEEKRAMFAEDEKSALAGQVAWDQKCMQKGNMMGDDPNKVPFIPDYCKEAAIYRGRTPKWLNDQAEGDIKTCSFCRKTIAIDAVKCPGCNEVVDRKRYDELKKQAA